MEESLEILGIWNTLRTTLFQLAPREFVENINSVDLGNEGHRN